MSKKLAVQLCDELIQAHIHTCQNLRKEKGLVHTRQSFNDLGNLVADVLENVCLIIVILRSEIVITPRCQHTSDLYETHTGYFICLECKSVIGKSQHS